MKTPTRLACVSLAMTAALSLSACDNNSFLPPPPSKPASAPAPEAIPAGHTMTLQEISNAAIPAACMHRPGRLVNGSLPPQPPLEGYVKLATNVPPAIGDLNGDGVNDAVTVLECTAGGVGWPHMVVAYVDGEPVAWSSLDDVNQARFGIHSLEIVDGTVHITGASLAPNDIDSYPTQRFDATYRLDDRSLVVVGTPRTWSI